MLPATRRLRRGLFIAVACGGLLLAWFGGVTPMIATGERGGDRCQRSYEARHGHVVLGVSGGGWSWRPYGTRCVITRGDGRTDEFVLHPYW